MSLRRGTSALGAAAHGSGACCASPLRRLRAGTVVCRGDASCASPCAIPASAQGFLSSNHRGSPAAARRRLEVSSQDGAWSWKDVGRLLPRLAQALLGAAADRRQPPPQGAGALCQHQGGAGERPSFSTLRARPNEHPSFHRRLIAAGPPPFKAKEVVLMQTKHETVLIQRRALQAPEVMLDDAAQARLGRLRPQQTQKSLQDGSSSTASNMHTIRGDGCRF
jgi:hypothetical protein